MLSCACHSRHRRTRALVGSPIATSHLSGHECSQPLKPAAGRSVTPTFSTQTISPTAARSATASGTIRRPSHTTGGWAIHGQRPKTRAMTSSTPQCTLSVRIGALTAQTAPRTVASYQPHRDGALVICASRVRTQAVMRTHRTRACRDGRFQTNARCVRVWKSRYTRRHHRRQRRRAYRGAVRHRCRRQRRPPCRRRASSSALTSNLRSTGGSTRALSGALNWKPTWRPVQWSPTTSLMTRALRWDIASIGMGLVRVCFPRRRTSLIGIAA